MMGQYAVEAEEQAQWFARGFCLRFTRFSTLTASQWDSCANPVYIGGNLQPNFPEGRTSRFHDLNE